MKKVFLLLNFVGLLSINVFGMEEFGRIVIRIGGHTNATPKKVDKQKFEEQIKIVEKGIMDAFVRKINKCPELQGIKFNSIEEFFYSAPDNLLTVYRLKSFAHDKLSFLNRLKQVYKMAFEKEENIENIKVFINTPFYFGENLLHVAIQQGLPELVKQLINLGADVNQKCWQNIGFFSPKSPLELTLFYIDKYHQKDNEKKQRSFDAIKQILLENNTFNPQK